MSSPTRLLILPAAFGLTLLCAPVWAEQPDAAPQAMPEDATTLLDEASEVESLTAEAIELEKVEKAKALEAQGEENVEAEISGAND